MDEIHHHKTEMQLAYEEFQETRFYKWCDSILIGRFHHLVLPITGFVDAFVVVLPTEAVLGMYLLRDKSRSLIKYTLLVSFFACIGYALLAVLSSLVGPSITSWFSFAVGSEVTTTVTGIVSSYVFVLALSAGVTSLVPMPATAFAIVVGLTGAPLGLFVAGIFIGKCIRFGGVAWIVRAYGMQAFDFYMKHATWVSLAMLVLLGLYFYIQ